MHGFRSTRNRRFLFAFLAMLVVIISLGLPLASASTPTPSVNDAIGDFRVYLPLITNSHGTPVLPGWETIVREDFEGAFPGDWELFDNNGATSGAFYWGKRDCRSFEGSFSGWAVGGGAQGGALGCGTNYPDDAISWMVYGPFSLEDATAGDVTFRFWLNTEQSTDRLCAMASLDGTHFSGKCVAGTTNGAWFDSASIADFHLDLRNAPNFGNLMGEPNVWIALIFESNGATTFSEGAYVDNVVLRKYVSPDGSAPAALQPEATDLTSGDVRVTHTTMTRPR